MTYEQIIHQTLDITSGEYKFINDRKQRKTVDIVVTDNKITFDFDYDTWLKDEVKSMDGARWNPDGKNWYAKNTSHNRFQIAYLRGLNPYRIYELPLQEFEFRIPLFPQQIQMAREGLTFRQVIWAAEMGLGKTASAFMVIENSQVKDWWWVGPRSALASYEVENEKWNLKIDPKVMTYEGLVKKLKNWDKTKDKLPQGIIFDESSRVKTPGSQRSAAAEAIAEAMRKEYGDFFPYIIEMTGTPAPKTPADWFHQCRIARPGFVKEGDIYKFKNRLAYIEKQENPQTGGFYPKLIAWKDGPDKCGVCGREETTHDFAASGLSHTFVPGPNEIAKLYRRMKGLVSVYYKKDWMQFLPEKQYRILRCKPSRSLINAAKIIKDSSSSAIQALTRLRELSDGFQYQDVPSGKYEVCSLCRGSKRVEVPDYNEDEVSLDQEVRMVLIDCTNCGGSGEVETIVRKTVAESSPKDDLLEEIIEDHEDDGRLVVFGGFTGSIDRVQEIFVRKGWEIVRVDGRGWHSSVHNWVTPKQMLQGFQDTSAKTGLNKVAYIGHPQSGGMGVTLTSSREVVHYSNDFNAESRMQSDDRIHRPGMDVNKGAMITDLVNLPSDELIIENLLAKKRLQDMSMGQFNASLNLDLER